MQGANVELRRQRDDIKGIHQKTQKMTFDIERAEKLVREMSMREFYKKAMLYGTIVLLFLAILLVLGIKIIR